MLRRILKEELQVMNLRQLQEELEYCKQELKQIKGLSKNDYDFRLKSAYIGEKIIVVNSLIQEKSN